MDSSKMQAMAIHAELPLGCSVVSGRHSGFSVEVLHMMQCCLRVEKLDGAAGGFNQSAGHKVFPWEDNAAP